MKRAVIIPIAVFVGIFVLWSVYRFYVVQAEWVDEFIAKPILQVVPVLLVVTYIERRSLASVFPHAKSNRSVIAGIGLGIVLIVMHWLVRSFTSSVVAPTLSGYGMTLILAATVAIATAVAEEIVFRGYFQSRFISATGSMSVSLIVTNLLFVLIHLPIIFFSNGYSLMDAGIYSIFLFQTGLVNSIALVYTGSLVTPIIAHAIWNFFNVIVRIALV